MVWKEGTAGKPWSLEVLKVILYINLNLGSWMRPGTINKVVEKSQSNKKS